MLNTPKNLDLEQIRKGFEMFDVDQTGKIPLAELLEAYDAMNLKDKNPFIYNLISTLSEEHEEVTIDDLITYIDEKLSDSQSQEGLNLIFDSLVEPNEDSLTLGNLPHIAKESEDRFTEKELRYLLERTQMGGDEINFEEFLKIVKENDENKENDNMNNGRTGGLKLSSGGKGTQPQQQIYKKKANTKPIENNKTNNLYSKKNNKNENKDSEENIIYKKESKTNNDLEESSEKKNKKKSKNL